jgi:hypothetical protein
MQVNLLWAIEFQVKMTQTHHTQYGTRLIKVRFLVLPFMKVSMYFFMEWLLFPQDEGLATTEGLHPIREDIFRGTTLPVRHNRVMHFLVG